MKIAVRIAGLLLALLLSACLCGAQAAPDNVIEGLETIEEEAFCSDASIESILLGENVRSVGPRAFAGCTNLTVVYCLSMDARIDATAFDGADKAVFYCLEGSTMERYARERGSLVLGPDGLITECDTLNNAAAGLPVTWTVTGVLPGQGFECLYTYELFLKGQSAAVTTVKDTADTVFSYTPKKGGTYTLRVTLRAGEHKIVRESEPLMAEDAVYLGIYEQDGSASTKDRLKWTVLAVEDGKALLITDRIIHNGSYFNPSWIKYKYTYWAHSYIGAGSSVNWWNNIQSEANKITGITPEHVPLKDRTWGTEEDLYYVHARYWCNNVFYPSSFTGEERDRILLTHNINHDSPQYGTDGGPDSDDYVFFLSYNELMRYMPTAESRKCLMTARASRESSDNIGRYWWLRTPARNPWNAIHVQGTTGGLSTYGSDVGHDNVGYRPCVWITIGG